MCINAQKRTFRVELTKKKLATVRVGIFFENKDETFQKLDDFLSNFKNYYFPPIFHMGKENN